MKTVSRWLSIVGWATILISPVGCRRQSDAGVTQSQTRVRSPVYFQAAHGFDGGLSEMVDLSKLDGFDEIRTVSDLARFASKVPGVVGFTAHPNFEEGTRHASAVLWYTRLSPTGSSWPLYLFDEQEAQKKPGGVPRQAAVAAAEAKISSKMEQARELIAAAGPKGVNLDGPFNDKALAFAILRLDGTFAHTGSYETDRCGRCRSVIPGGDPGSCGLGVQHQEHWNCCGSTDKTGRCDYWKLVKAQDEARQ
ncbi:MAG: hypothetical protein U1G07_06860 [Verrucomicrobiota bacterium]